MKNKTENSGNINDISLAANEDKSIHNMQRDCSQGDSAYCNRNKLVRLTIVRGKEDVTIDCMKDESILSALVRNGIYISAVCGGKGSCGKCKIQIQEGCLDISDYDRIKLSKKELDTGIRLSCKSFPKEDLRIHVVSDDTSGFEIISDYDEEMTGKEKNQKMLPDEGYIIGIDIGTTTIALNLVGVTSKQIINTAAMVNGQRTFGADVISRIAASNAGKKVPLRECIQKNLQEGIRKIIEDAGINKTRIKQISIAGNTTMGHLLMGYSCETLGIYPYTPVNIGRIEKGYEEIIGDDYLNIPVILLPGISTYVGGDIVSGLLSCDFDKKDKVCMLIDLGTNGEMALGNRERIMVCSTAAGPAFEGGNISSGIGSVAGAISNVSIIDGKVRYKTIADAPPVGICGTGVIEIVSELFKNGIIDETGLLDDQYFEDGYVLAKDPEGNRIVMTQKDIREIQVAKAAVSAGIRTLITRYGVSYDEIESVYIAGGFGYKIDIDKTIHIGLLPEEFKGKTKAVGNSSLTGAVKYLTLPEAVTRVDKLLSISEELNLSNDQVFQELYIESMLF